MGKTRDVSLDVEAGIVILLVIIGHLVPYNQMLFRWIFAFHMPFFFYKAGICTSDKVNEKNFFVFVGGACKRYLVPSWVFKSCCVAFKIKECFSLKEILVTVFLDPRLEWFCYALFFSRIALYIYVFVTRKCSKQEKYTLAAFIVSISFFYVNWRLESGLAATTSPKFIVGASIAAFSLVLIGFFMKGAKDRFFANINIKNKLLIIIFVGILLVYLNKYNEYVNVADHCFGRSDIYFVFSSIFWCYCGLEISRVICTYLPHLKAFLAYCGRNSIYIYLVQGFLITIVNLEIYYKTGVLYQNMVNMPVWLSVVDFFASVIVALIISKIVEIIKNLFKRLTIKNRA